MKTFLISLGAICSLIVVAGCGTSTPTNSGATSSNSVESGAVKKLAPENDPKNATSAIMASENKVGMVRNAVYVAKDGKPLCPVQGDELATTKGAKFQVYKGVKYYFCCNTCPSLFAKNPAKYAFKGK